MLNLNSVCTKICTVISVGPAKRNCWEHCSHEAQRDKNSHQSTMIMSRMNDNNQLYRHVPTWWHNNQHFLDMSVTLDCWLGLIPWCAERLIVEYPAATKHGNFVSLVLEVDFFSENCLHLCLTDMIVSNGWLLACLWFDNSFGSLSSSIFTWSSVGSKILYWTVCVQPPYIFKLN